ncbi:DUF3187 family protein [Vibrio splendidus]|nr:DUF3187 family protein [Vibrio splendidus]
MIENIRNMDNSTDIGFTLGCDSQYKSHINISLCNLIHQSYKISVNLRYINNVFF